MASEALLAMLREAEGWRSKPYLCPAAKWTIGYGSTGPDITEDSPEITKEQGEALLVAEVERVEKKILSLCPMLIGEPQARIDAMIDFGYNMGTNRVKATTLEKRIAAKDWLGAAAQLRRWVYATVDGKAQKLPGLVKRREKAAKWMAEGVH